MIRGKIGLIVVDMGLVGGLGVDGVRVETFVETPYIFIVFEDL